MKNIIATIFLVLFTLATSQAQDKKFDFGIRLFPNFSMETKSNDGNTPTAVEDIYKEIEIWKPSLSADLFVEYKLNRKSIIGIGIGYQNNGVKNKKIELFVLADPNDPLLPTEVKIIRNHHNLEIPLYYKYKFGNRYYLILGTSTIINLSNTITSKQFYVDGSKKKNTDKDNTTDFRKFNFFGNFGFGIDYFNNEKISLFVQPYVQYGFLEISKNASLNRNILSIGVSTGIRI